MRVTRKKISILHLGKGTEYSYYVVKKLVGQGLLYVGMKKDFQFVIDDSISDLEPPPVFSTPASTTAPLVVLPTSNVDPVPSPVPSPPNTVQQVSHASVNDSPFLVHSLSEQKINGPDEAFFTLVNAFPSRISEPTEILRYL